MLVAVATLLVAAPALAGPSPGPEPEPESASEPEPAPARPATARPTVIGPDALSALAKRLQSPVAEILSLPVAYTAAVGVGTDDDVAHGLTVQAFIPIPAGLFDIITRTRLPVTLRQPAPRDAARPADAEAGVGDLTSTWFLTLSEPCMATWGVGPAWSFPTASSDMLGSGQLGLGPAATLLVSPGRWVIGGMLSWIWGIAGEADRADLERTEVQVFIYYNLPRGWYLATAPTFTADWARAEGEEWTVPLGGGIGKVVLLGPTALDVQVYGYGNVVKPEGGADATVGVEVRLVLPSLY